MSKQTDRISKNEKRLNAARKVLDKLETALNEYTENAEEIRKLEKYYTGGEWRKDFEARENGRLPDDLRCGVLSEDAVYDLLTDESELLYSLSEVISRYQKERNR